MYCEDYKQRIEEELRFLGISDYMIKLEQLLRKGRIEGR